MNRRDLAVGMALLGLAIIFLAPVTLGGRVLVPFDDLFRIPPWKSFASQFGVGVPHNELALDLLAENLVWKKFIVESLRARELPLWNPYLFAGVPFLAAGQHSALYPFSILFYVLPVDRAFGYFTALQLAIAAATMYAFGRILRLSRFSSLVSAVVYAFSTFMVVSTTFPMVLGAAAWLPGILACFEFIARDSGQSERLASRTLLAALIGALLVGLQFLAGHVEISIYILLVSGLYALCRLAIPSLTGKKWRGLGQGIMLTAGVLGIGIALGSVQLVPLYELAQQNFRSGSVSYQDVVGWAYPPRQLITFLIPDFYGNPSRHSYIDPFDLTTKPVPNDTIDWGKKNYVEAGSYLGILPLLLAAVAVFAMLKRKCTGRLLTADDSVRPAALFFAGLALVSLLFIFGTPLYAVLFFLLPGFDQLHTPFRWVFPYTLSMAVLAGIGTQLLADQHGRIDLPFQSNRMVAWFGRTFPWIFIWSGAAVIAALGLALVFRSLTLSLADRLVRSSNLATAAFGNGQTLFSYEFRNVFLFGLLLLGAGAVLRVSRCPIYLPERLGRHPVWKPLALVLIIADLFVIGLGFYPSADPKIADFTPPAIQFLQQDPSYYRITSYDGPDTKVLNPNVGMLYHLSDIRGYDSIIPKQYANLMGALAPQDQLLNNRIAPFYNPDPLSSPIVNLLNVKYVLTERPVPNSGYTLVYDQEIKIYRNESVLPRAFLVPQARVIANRAALLEEMKQFDPTREVLLDQNPALGPQPISATACSPAPVTIKTLTGNRVEIESTQSCPGWLVLSDSYSPGWLAELDGQGVPLYRADYNFRAVYLPEGTHLVLFKYSPISLRVGVIGSFLGGMLLLLGFAYLGWRRFYHPDAESQIQLVAKNSLLPIATSLLMKGVNLVYAAFTLRMLGPTGNGTYIWAISIWVLTSTITDFGLGILLTREVSRDRSQANRYLVSATVLRVLLWLAALLLPLGFIAADYVGLYHVTLDAVATLGFLVLGILPSTLAASLAFLFNAYERFEYRVAVDVLSSMVQITLGVIVLLLGFGYVGLAASTILTNLFTLGSLYYLVRTRLFIPHWEFDRNLTRTMVSESYPLMLNNLLSGIFFRVDTLILQPYRGYTELGYYGAAYSFINSLNFIPSSFTLAIFPALSRMAASAKEAMLRAYLLSIKLLLWISLPITVGTVFISHELIRLVVGEAYLPHSAIALQLLIIFLPFSYVNSVTHYVLIALGQQRFLTKAFLIGAVFNIAANLIAVPPLGYVGAAIVTILSEIVLLIPFYYSVRKNLASIPFAALAWRPVVASGVMGLALWALLPYVGMLAAIPVAASLYAVLLVALGALGEDERTLLRRLLPQRLHPVLRLSA